MIRHLYIQFTCPIAIGLVLLVFCATSAYAQSNEAAGPQIGAALNIQLRHADGLDNNRVDNDTGRIRANLELGVRQQFNEISRLVARLELRAEYLTEKEAREQADFDYTTYQLERLYYQQDLTNQGVRWRIGRQKIDDVLGHAIDEIVDGLRLTLENDTLQIDLSYTREDWVQASSEDRSDETFNALAQFTYSRGKKNTWMPYVLHRNARALNVGDEVSKTTWFGLQGAIQPSDSWRYWMNAALRKGDETDDAEKEDLGGHESGIGLSWLPEASYNPVFSISIARGSHDYRQSGLHSNEFQINGANTFRYLGEVLDPELANLQILTFSAGAKPTNQWRTDLSLHTYRQVKLEDNIRGSDVNYEPDGQSRDIGTAVDIIASYQRSEQLEFEAKAGIFNPGSAFDDQNRDFAWLTGVEMKYNF